MKTSSKSISLLWKNFSKNTEEYDILKAQLSEYNPTIEVLSRIIEDKLDHLRSKRVDIKDYESSAWPFKQAEINGEEKVLTEILNLLN